MCLDCTSTQSAKKKNYATGDKLKFQNLSLASTTAVLPVNDSTLPIYHWCTGQMTAAFWC